eukprot:1752275-Alexandrium_andersonii.AAC.1
MARMWNFCTTTQPEKLTFMQMFARFMQDSKTFRAPNGVLRVGLRPAGPPPGDQVVRRRGD